MYIREEDRAILLSNAPLADERNDFDDWLDTPAGLAWLDNAADAYAMTRRAETFGTRPGF